MHLVMPQVANIHYRVIYTKHFYFEITSRIQICQDTLLSCNLNLYLFFFFFLDKVKLKVHNYNIQVYIIIMDKLKIILFHHGE
jgi:hypothetical protein